MKAAAACLAVNIACLLVMVTSAVPDGADPSSTKITFDLDKGHAVTSTLWGIFFEEVGPVPKLVCRTGAATVT